MQGFEGYRVHEVKMYQRLHFSIFKCKNTLEYEDQCIPFSSVFLALVWCIFGKSLVEIEAAVRKLSRSQCDGYVEWGKTPHGAFYLVKWGRFAPQNFEVELSF